MGREESIFFPLYHFYPPTNIQKFVCCFASEMTTLLLTIAHAIGRLLINEIYQPLEISNFNLFADIMQYDKW